MNPVCVAVYDKKAQAFLTPLFYPDPASAERAFCALVGSADTTIGQWYDDFDMYRLGFVDPVTGKLTSCDHPDLIITGQSAYFAISELRRKSGGESCRGELPPEDKRSVSEADKTSIANDPASITSKA